MQGTESALLRRAGRVEARSMTFPVTDLPLEIQEHVASFLPNLALASTSRAMRGVALHVAGVTSIFELVVLAALRCIPGDDIAARIQLLQRALAAGHRADLFTWPQAVPSELREHVCQWGGPVAHSLPLEHNLTVHISNPDDPDAALFLPIKSIDAYRPCLSTENAWVPGSPVQCVHVNLAAPAGGGNYRFQYPGPAQFQWFPGFLGQLTLNGDTATASNINTYNGGAAGGQQCCRRMAVVLRPRRP